MALIYHALSWPCRVAFRESGGAVKHAFTVDVEDWYQGIPIGPEARASAERRLDRGLNLLLEMLAQHKTHATFFLLGPVVEEHPQLIQRIAACGHEIGCHGWSHDLLYEMTPERFRNETERAVDVITSVTGRPVAAYRAAYFSITKRSLWALDVLASLGFRYDSSIFPVRNWRYGIPDFAPWPQRLETRAGPIYELPISTRRMLGRNVPASGGAYFRFYPFQVTRANYRALEAKQRPIVFYIHPWELDPGHPRVPFYWKAHLTHYVNLHSTGKKLRRLLTEFEFGPLGQVLEHELPESRS
jgi:polysaccharide deacetylase family protein (PEP-CTERM system associated)